jgi:hypothetical protein
MLNIDKHELAIILRFAADVLSPATANPAPSESRLTGFARIAEKADAGRTDAQEHLRFLAGKRGIALRGDESWQEVAGLLEAGAGGAGDGDFDVREDCAPVPPPEKPTKRSRKSATAPVAAPVAAPATGDAIPTVDAVREAALAVITGKGSPVLGKVLREFGLTKASAAPEEVRAALIARLREEAA